ncbi:MAG: hypothetical protein NC180_01910 [Muribaculaceae bacterium]|nr:hypothetical protein [Roseburia sp.]MCM1430697.1 hypothetical protein [Muribaculaceae bacterium]MCM1491964.1 hypothetical protein [Muribaculaceae bacterium]
MNNMSNSVKIDLPYQKNISVQDNMFVCNTKDAGVKVSGIKEKDTSNTVDTILNISGQARLKLKNAQNDGTVKKAGITSAREVFEEEARDRREYERNRDLLLRDDIILMDEPETYVKMMEAQKKCIECEWASKEQEQWVAEYVDIRLDWYRRRCFDDNEPSGIPTINPVEGKCCLISTLQQYYSDAEHDTSFDVYALDKYSDLWKFGTKFNVLIPIEMLNDLETLNHMELLSEEEKEELNQRLEKVDDAVHKMKDVEKNYEGSLKYLRFAVKFDHEGNVTFHANYTGCGDKNGISADSPEELLEKLMSK